MFIAFHLDLSTSLLILTLVPSLRFVRILDELFLLADNLEKQIHIFKVADGKIPHQILSVDFCNFSRCGYFLFLNVLAAKVVFGMPVLTRLTLYGYQASSSVYADGREGCLSKFGVHAAMILSEVFFAALFSHFSRVVALPEQS